MISEFTDIVCSIDLTEWERRMMLAVAKECVRAQNQAWSESESGIDSAEENARFARWQCLEAKLEAKS